MIKFITQDVNDQVKRISFIFDAIFLSQETDFRSLEDFGNLSYSKNLNNELIFGKKGIF